MIRLPFYSVKKRCPQLILLAFILFTPFLTAQQGLEFQEKENAYVRFPISLSIDPRSDIQRDMGVRAFSIAGWVGGLMPRQPFNARESVEVDSTGQYMVASTTLRDYSVKMPRIMTLEQYQEQASQRQAKEDWRQAIVRNVLEGPAGRRKGGGGLSIDIPVPIQSKTFQKIFGGDKVGLNVQGDIRINGGFRNEDRSEAKTTLAQTNNTHFKMNQTQRFTVTGKIGEKVTVNVDQDSERAFDFDNNLKLNYTGFEDEVIQSIEAGNISLNLPGTRFVTSSGGNAGLFGIKTEIQLGDLRMIAVASQEKGQSSQLSVEGGASGQTSTVKDIDYKQYTYFFLDTLFRNNFQEYKTKWQPYSAPIQVGDIEVFQKIDGAEVAQSNNIYSGWAFIDPDLTDAEKAGLNEDDSDNRTAYKGNFKKLNIDEDYFLVPELGYIYFQSPLMQDDVIAVSYTVEQSDTPLDTVGTYFGDDTNGQNVFLKLIKNSNPLPADSLLWSLMWKNVYNLGSRNIPKEGFDLKIYKENPSGTDLDTDDNGTNYLEIFGLDNYDENGNATPDDIVDLDPSIVNLTRGELIFPFLEPFNPTRLGGDLNEEPLLAEDEFIEEVYNLEPGRTQRNSASNFYISIESKNRSSTYNLGFNVIENSEKVRFNGANLTRGVDYTIEYLSGTLTILNEAATAPNANLDITYERNQFFQLDKKTILGTRAEYQFGEESILAGTFYYLNERTLDQKVRVGRGPMRNMIWDINGSFKFTPDFLTKAVDLLPLVRAEQESRLNIEAEIAQIIPNPNTLNSPETGDNQGVAYIDDFEGSERPTPLSIMRKAWTQASAPVPIKAKFTNSQHVMAQRGDFNWYNPFERVHKNTIWPELEVNSQTGQLTDILVLRLDPIQYQERELTESWGGVMRALSSGFYNQSESKFIEVVVAGDKGELIIDLGTISEDVIPNGILDTEDEPVGRIYLGTLDDGEDIGLDGMANADVAEYSNGTETQDWWDINANGIREEWEPYSNDDYPTGTGVVANYDQINGTENNKRDGAQIPDTEDLNGNSSLDTGNSYFSYRIDLEDPAYPYFIGSLGGTGGYKLYRIPLKVLENEADEFRQINGSASLTNIQYARLWATGVTEQTEIRIADVSITGNEWKEQGTAQYTDTTLVVSDTEDDKIVSVSVYNTVDNPNEYTPPPGVEGVIDRITKVRAKEQSLRLEINDLPAQNYGMVKKTFFQDQDYIHYKRLKMFVAAAGENLSLTDPTGIEIFIRFGATSQNYYEVRQPLHGLETVDPGRPNDLWNELNEFDVDFFELTSLKFRGEGVVEDSLGIGNRLTKTVEGKTYSIVGNPSISKVKEFYVGIVNHRNETFSGEVWLDELRIVDVEREKAIAMRASVDLGLSDVMSINANIEKRDADFHNVGERFGSGSEKQSYSVSGQIQLHKFLPQSWGLSIPVSANYGNNTTTPKYDPAVGDIVLAGNVDGDELEEKKTISNNMGVNVSLRKSRKSDNFFLKYTLDNISAKLNHTKSNQKSPTVVSAESKNWTGGVDYNLTFGQNTFVEPLKFLGALPLLNRYSDTKLYYFPRNLTASANGTDVKTENQKQTLQGVIGEKTENSTRGLTKAASINYKLTDQLSSNLSRNWSGDVKGGWLEAFTAFNDTSVYIERNKSQNFKADFSPELLSFLTNSFSYSSQYRFTNNPAQGDRALNASTNNNITANATLKTSQIFKKSTSRGGTTRRRPRPRQEQPGETEGEKEEEEKKRSIPNPLTLLKKVAEQISRLKDIRATYSTREQFTNSAIIEEPGEKYKFGFVNAVSAETFPTAEGVDGVLFNTNKSKSLSLTSGLQFGRNLDIGLKYNFSDQSTLSTQSTGNFSDSRIKIDDQPGDENDVYIPFPEISVTISGLEKIGPLKRWTKNLTVSTNFTGKKATYWRDTRDDITKKDFQVSFRPLFRTQVSLKNGITANFAMNKSTDENTSFNANGDVVLLNTGDKNSTDDMNVSASYSKRSGFYLPLPFLNNKRLNNSIDFTVTFSSSSTTTERWNKTEEEWEEFQSTSRWSFQPKIQYTFSSRVSGGAHFEFGANKSKLAGETKIKEFLIDVNISIRGN